MASPIGIAIGFVMLAVVSTPLVTQAVTRFALIVVLVPVLLLAGQGLDPERIARGFGPLRTVLASPAFHRWHHTSAAEGRDRNFAGLLPLWDLLFGTFYMPDRQPTVFGVDDKVPTHLPGQLLWPFRRDHGGFTITR